MTPRQHNALLHWLEYCKVARGTWWTDGGYIRDHKGDFR